MPLSPQARDLVIRVILAEAGGEGPEGQLAVANVIRNRALSGAWGDPEKGGLTRLLTAPKQFAAPASVSPNDPMYQRVAAIVDQMASQPVEDNTGGATHFYAPGGMPGGVAPDWASQGTNVRRIGNQIFMTAPFNPETTAGTVNNPVITGPAMGGGAAAAPGNFAYGGQTPQDQGIDLRHVDPVFKARIDQLLADAAAAGIKAHVVSGYRDNQNQAGLYAKYKSGQGGMAAPPGESYHNFGRAIDIVTDDPRQQSQLTALAAQPWRNIRPGATFGDYDHYEAAEGRTAALVASGQVAKAGPSEVSHPDGSSLVGPPAGSNAPLGASLPGAPVVPAPNPDVPAPQVQPVKATSPQTTASPPAASPAAPGANDRFQLNYGIPVGQGGQRQMFTSLNLTPGAVAPFSSPIPAPTPAPQATPPDQTPLPPPRPAGFGINQGALAANAPLPPPRPSDISLPNNSAGGKNPNMVDPRFGNPVASTGMPPDVFASAQNLLKLLFPTG